MALTNCLPRSTWTQSTGWVSGDLGADLSTEVSDL